MIRYGEVSSIFPERGTVKVIFKDLSDIPTVELPVFQGRTHQTKHYSMPKIGEVGLCLFPENSFNGFYLGSGYDEALPIPAGAGENVEITIFKDGTVVSYDENSSKLYINANNEIEIIAKKMKISCPVIDITGDINHTGNLTSSGNTSIGGSMTATGDVSGKGINLSTHTHGSVMSGNGRTGGPQ